MSATLKPSAPVTSQLREGRSPKELNAAAAKSKKLHTFSPPRDVETRPLDESQIATEETVTLSPVSSLLSSVLDASPSPPRAQGGRKTKTATTNVDEAENSAEPVLSPPNKAQSGGEMRHEARITSDARWSEQLPRYLEAARLLREMRVSIEARERFLHGEIQRQKTFCAEKKVELEKKSGAYQRLLQSTSRLTRQVRNLDSENDRMRDRLEELGVAFEKMLLKRKRKKNETSSLAPQNGTRRVWENKGPRRGDTAGPTKPQTFAVASSTDSLTRNKLAAGLDACNRKLQLAEEQRKEMLNELQLVVARKKGRALAYSTMASSSASEECFKELGWGDSCFTNTVVEEAVIQRLERMIDDSLVRCENNIRVTRRANGSSSGNHHHYHQPFRFEK